MMTSSIAAASCLFLLWLPHLLVHGGAANGLSLKGLLVLHLSGLNRADAGKIHNTTECALLGLVPWRVE